MKEVVVSQLCLQGRLLSTVISILKSDLCRVFPRPFAHGGGGFVPPIWGDKYRGTKR